MSSDGAGQLYQNIEYNTDRTIYSLSSPTTSEYRFSYNDIGDALKVYLNSSIPLVSYEYDNGDTSLYVGRLTKKTYGNNKDGYKFIYNSQGLVSEIDYFKGTSTSSRFYYNYDNKGRLFYSGDDLLQFYLRTYYYDEIDKIVKIALNHDGQEAKERLEYIYDEKDNGYILKESHESGEYSLETASTYDKRKIYSSNSITTAILSNFYTCWFNYGDNESELYYLRKYDSNSEIVVIKKDYGNVQEVKNENNVYYHFNKSVNYAPCYNCVDNNSKKIKYGFLVHISEIDVIRDIVLAESLYFDEDSDIFYGFRVVKTEDDLLIKYIEIGTDGIDGYTEIITGIYGKLKLGWNFVGVNIVTATNNTTFDLFLNNEEIQRIYINNDETCKIRDHNDLKLIIGGTYFKYNYSYESKITGIFMSYENLSNDELRQYRDAVMYNVITPLNKASTWNQDVINEKVIYSDLNQSGLTQIDYIPLQGDFITLNKKMPSITYRNSYAELTNTPFIYFGEYPKKVFDANKFGSIRYQTSFTGTINSITFKVRYYLLGGTNNGFTEILRFGDLKVYGQVVSDTTFKLAVSYNSSSVTIFDEEHPLLLWNDIKIEVTSLGVTITQNDYDNSYNTSISLSNDLIILGEDPNILYGRVLYGLGNVENKDSIVGVEHAVVGDTASRIKATYIKKEDSLTDYLLYRSFEYKSRIETEDEQEITYTSTQISTEYIGNPSLLLQRARINYSYDDLGRLTGYNYYRSSSSLMADKTITYTYNTRGFLNSEQNMIHKRVYEYDNNGNITSVQYGYSFDTTLKVMNYTYNSTYLDRIDEINDNGVVYKFNYDSLDPHRISSVVNQASNSVVMSFNFEGRRLTKLTFDNTNYVNYYYDDQGVRLSKEVVNNGTSTYHYYNYLGNKLISESRGNTFIKYFYGVDDKLLYFELIEGNSKTRYYYLWDLLNIRGLLDENGNIVVEYDYDGYGNIISIGGTLSSTIGVINPFRYKGYYYDEESNFYYCLSRYYNPYWRRFVEPGSESSLDPTSITGLNLFSYCKNDPINLMEMTKNDFYSKGNYENQIKINDNNSLKLPELPWIIENSTAIYGSISSLITGVPIFIHYFRFSKNINSEFKLYNISKLGTSKQLANVNFKLSGLDGLLIGANVLIDMYDSYQRGVSDEGILLGGLLTAASSIAMLYLNKGLMWLTTTIGTIICPGLGTAIGFAIGLVGSILVDFFLGGWIADQIDNNIK